MQTTNSKPFAPVALVQAQQYDPALIDRAVERLLELLNIPGEWFCGKRVLIKPNLLMRRQPQEATTTHPLLIKSLADWLYRAKAAQVIIADCPGWIVHPCCPARYLPDLRDAASCRTKRRCAQLLMSATGRSLPKTPASAANLTSSIRWCRQI